MSKGNKYNAPWEYIDDSWEDIVKDYNGEKVIFSGQDGAIFIGKANAKLIAAAPEMLEMLKEYSKNFCKSKCFHQSMLCNKKCVSLTKIEQLIEKAGGEVE